jgi:hypothetical protein
VLTRSNVQPFVGTRGAEYEDFVHGIATPRCSETEAGQAPSRTHPARSTPTVAAISEVDHVTLIASRSPPRFAWRSRQKIRQLQAWGSVEMGDELVVRGRIELPTSGFSDQRSTY